MIFLMVGIANILDVHIIGTGSVLRTSAIFFYVSNEGISLLENAAHLGLPVPEKIKRVTLNVYTHMGLDDAEKELQKMQGLENARKEMGISDKDDKLLKQNMFKVV